MMFHRLQCSTRTEHSCGRREGYQIRGRDRTCSGRRRQIWRRNLGALSRNVFLALRKKCKRIVGTRESNPRLICFSESKNCVRGWGAYAHRIRVKAKLTRRVLGRNTITGFPCKCYVVEAIIHVGPFDRKNGVGAFSILLYNIHVTMPDHREVVEITAGQIEFQGVTQVACSQE